MRAESRDRFLANLDATAKALGGNDFQHGIEIGIRALNMFLNLLRAVETREQLIKGLDDLQIPREWESLMIQAAENGPQLLRWMAMKWNQTAEESLPALPSRGPAVSGTQQLEILRYINKLEFEKRVPRQIAKQRAAQKFDCSVRTIERLWKERDEILANGPRYNFNELMVELQRALEADNAPWIPKSPAAPATPLNVLSSGAADSAPVQ